MLKQSALNIVLLCVLVVFFILNQLAYCVVAIVFYVIEEKRDTTFESLCEDADFIENLWLCYDFVNCLGCTRECISRSLNFYFYYFITKSMRVEFKRALRLDSTRVTQLK